MIALTAAERTIADACAPLGVAFCICRGGADLMSDDERTDSMDNKRHEDEIHKQADRLHDYAQRTGQPVDYVKAAEMYEAAGDYFKASKCREAAERLERR